MAELDVSGIKPVLDTASLKPAPALDTSALKPAATLDTSALKPVDDRTITARFTDYLTGMPGRIADDVKGAFKKAGESATSISEGEKGGLLNPMPMVRNLGRAAGAAGDAASAALSPLTSASHELLSKPISALSGGVIKPEEADTALMAGRPRPGRIGAATPANPASLGIERVVDDLKRIFAPGERGPEARATAGAMRERGGKLEQSFQRAAENLRSFGREVGNLPRQDRLQFIDAVETGNLGRFQGTPLGQLGTELRTLFDARWREMDARGIAPNYVEDYFPHLWQDPAAAAGVFRQGSSLQGQKGFTKGRTFATLADGMAAGLVPLTDNPIELSLLQLHQMDRYITAQDVFNEMKGLGHAQLFGGNSAARPPAGWIPIDDKIARTPHGMYYAPEQAATIVNRALSPGLGGRPAYDLVRSTGNMMNSAQLGLSGFHALFVTADAATSRIAKGVKQISRGTPGEITRGLGNIFSGRAFTAPVENYLKGRKVLEQYLGRGQHGPEMQRIVDALVKGGGRVRMDQMYRSSAMGSFWQGFRGSLVKSSGRMTLGQELREMFAQNSPGKAAAMLAPRVMDTVMAPLMEDMVPKMKLGVFYDLMADELRVNPQADLRQTAARLWDSVDNRLGQLVYDNLFWNKMMRDVGHVAVRSLGWNLGTIRELAGGAADLRKGRSVAAGSGAQITDRASYVVAMPIGTAMMGAIYGYLKTGKGPQELKDYFFPQTGGFDEKGMPQRVSMPGYMKDAVEWAEQPGQTTVNKLHPLWGALKEMMSNRDFYGAAITDPNDPQMRDYMRFMADQFSPMSLRKQPENPDSRISGPEQFFGIREAPWKIRNPEAAEGYQRKDDARAMRKKQQQDQRFGR